MKRTDSFDTGLVQIKKPANFTIYSGQLFFTDSNGNMALAQPSTPKAQLTGVSNADLTANMPDTIVRFQTAGKIGLEPIEPGQRKRTWLCAVTGGTIPADPTTLEGEIVDIDTSGAGLNPTGVTIPAGAPVVGACRIERWIGNIQGQNLVWVSFTN